MDIINFVQTGGFPVKCERLQEVQTAYSIFNELGHLAGNLTILSGCNVVGTSVSDGYVFIDGEVLKFKAGFISSDVIIIQNESDKEFENGEIKAVHYERYATFGTSETSWAWEDFTRLVSLRELKGRILPPGTNPQLYCGNVANIPAGWFLCDGEEGRPNLKGQFIVGLDPDDPDYDEIGKSGGLKKVTPIGTLNNATLNITIPRDGWGTNGGNLGTVASGRLVVGSGVNENAEALESLRSSGNNNTVSGTHSHIFTGTEHENRPIFYTLAYIIYIG